MTSLNVVLHSYLDYVFDLRHGPNTGNNIVWRCYRDKALAIGRYALGKNQDDLSSEEKASISRDQQTYDLHIFIYDYLRRN